MTDLERYEPPQALALPEHESWMRVYEPLIDLAGRLQNSPFVPDSMRGNPGDTFAVLLAGHGLGLSPIQSLQSIVLISKKPYISTEVILGLALRAGHQVQWLESTDKRATVRVTRGDGRASAEVTYTMSQAQAAGLTNKDNWRRMPAEMLRARAVRAALKMCAPDIALGLEAAENPAVAAVEAPAGGTTVVQVARPAQGTAATLKSGDDYSRLHPDPSTEPVAVDPEPQPDTAPVPEPEPEPISPAQMRKLRAVLADWNQLQGLPRDPDRDRDLIGSLIGRPLASAKDLTKAEATAAIDALADLVRTVTDPQPEQEVEQ